MKELVRGALITLAAVAFLHATLSLYYWLTGWSLVGLARPSWESLGLIAVLALWTFKWPAHERLTRALRVALTTLVLIYFLLGIGQAFASREFGYDVILVLHIPFLPVLLGMMYNTEPLGMFLLYVFVLIAGLTVVIGGSYLAIGRVLRYCDAGNRQRAAVLGLMGAYTLAAGLALGVNPPLTKQLVHQVDMAINFDERIHSTAEQISVETAAFRRSNPIATSPKKPNIFFFIIESYGQVLFEDEDFSAFRDDLVPRMEETLNGQGFHVRSRFLLSPVFGGSSWMADASLMCGVKIHDQRRFESLATSSVRCLPELLNDAGYYTVMGAANTTYIDDVYARLYPYDEFFYKDRLAYQGVRYGWSFMPDQYVINFVHENGVKQNLGQRPVFASYMLTTSHHPWNKIPPFINDWSTIGDGSIYKRLRARSYRNAFVSGSQYKSGFATSIEYALRSIERYLTLLPEDDAIIIVLGDHQPRQPIALKDEDPWAVPIHILSRDRATLDRFAQFGYVDGFAPDPASLDGVGFEQLLLQLLKVFSAQPQEPTNGPTQGQPQDPTTEPPTAPTTEPTTAPTTKPTTKPTTEPQ
ncbi:MAG: hypothetical protein Tsb0020_06730 [Haliangiales bacterium]